MIPLLLIGGFVVGSIPFGVLIAGALGVDIRKHGSGNIGATNVARVIGLGPGLLVLALDSAKGALAAALGLALCGPTVAVATGLAAIIGHCFSPFLRGKGGKGVATALGVFGVLAPALAVVAVAVFLFVAGRTRVPALGSLAGMAATTVFAFATRAGLAIEMLTVATAVVLVYTHRANLAKLRATR